MHAQPRGPCHGCTQGVTIVNLQTDGEHAELCVITASRPLELSRELEAASSVSQSVSQCHLEGQLGCLGLMDELRVERLVQGPTCLLHGLQAAREGRGEVLETAFHAQLAARTYVCPR